jgi:CMP/dCMP kinase
MKNSKRRSRKKISVIISGMPCVGKTTAADVIAKKFHLTHLAGGDMLKQIAIERGYRPSGTDWWDEEEGMAFLKERKNNPEFDREVDRRLIQRIKVGGVVVTSYPVPWICRSGLKIWFDAPPKVRSQRLAKRDSITFAKALRIVRERDQKNRRLYKELYGIDFGKDLSVFNYLIDTESLSAEEVAAAALKIVSETFISRARTRNDGALKIVA